jgi:hypothetical protein
VNITDIFRMTTQEKLLLATRLRRARQRACLDANSGSSGVLLLSCSVNGQGAYLLNPLPVRAFLWDVATQRFIGWNDGMLSLLRYTALELSKLD